ncbi:MAG TPA: phosphoribosyltransferase family protein [Solirubrobacteraceae bacterium]|nr:phosphoribosyltransferase family protein [Solirubrobacteraceae bacterium]
MSAISGDRRGAVNSLEELPFGRPDDGRRFADRHDAGRRLAVLLERFRDQHPIVIGIPRGGVPVAAEIARALSAPLDIVVVRKIGAPGNAEYAIGALAEGDAGYVDDQTIAELNISPRELKTMLDRARQELAERIARYRRNRPPLALAGRTVLLIDDGLATGRSARAAAESLYRRGAARVVLAVPVAAPSSAQELRASVEEVVALQAPADMWAIGLWYEDFSPTSDEEVSRLLAAHGHVGQPIAREVEIEMQRGVTVTGDLVVPLSAQGIVAFAHGSGSSRLSPRNRAVAAALNDAGIATLLFDLLTGSEETERANVFDIPLLARRLLVATRWLERQPETGALALGYFGASTGAAAALIAAAAAGARVCAIVSRGGRPDLASTALARVSAPTLLIVGGDDHLVLELNREAREQLRCESRLAVIPHASHLFEEPGALEQVSRLAIDWFRRYLVARRRAGGIAPARGAQ